MNLLCLKQPQKKGVSPDTQKNLIKPVKDALSVNLSPAPPMTNVLSAAERSCRGQTAKMWTTMGSEGLESKVVFDLEGGVKIKPPVTNEPVISR